MKIFAICYFLFYLFKKCLNYIVYPLKIYNKLNKIENFLLFNSTYTSIEIGKPPQKVNFYFSLNHNKMNMTDIDCQDINLFDIDYSETFIIVGFPDEDEIYSSKIFSVDTISFYDDINLTKFEEKDEYFMYYYVDLNKTDVKYVCGSIGIGLMEYESYDEEVDEIEYYLKFIRAQYNYFSFFHYNGEDYFINGIFLHQEFKNMFQNIQNISWINPIIRENSLKWEISMKEIYYNKIHLKDKIIFELNPLFELIIGTNDYKIKILEDFFNYYINKQICLINETNDYQIIECDDNKFGIKDIQAFPILYMINSNINHVFEMIGEELFIKLNNKYYFGIIFPIKNFEYNKWILGKIFMRKYPVVFSPINRLVGFYVNPNWNGEDEMDDFEEKEENMKKKGDQKEINNSSYSKDFYLYLKIWIIALIFTCFGIYIGRKLFLQRKRKVNELVDDYYQYNSGTKSDQDKNVKNKVENNFSSIEMSNKI